MPRASTGSSQSWPLRHPHKTHRRALGQGAGMMLLWVSRGVFEELVGAACDVSFEAAADLAGGLAFGEAAGGGGLGFGGGGGVRTGGWGGRGRGRRRRRRFGSVRGGTTPDRSRRR